MRYKSYLDNFANKFSSKISFVFKLLVHNFKTTVFVHTVRNMVFIQA